MGLAINILASLSLVLGGAFGVELLFERYATPEARPQGEANDRPQQMAEAGRTLEGNH